MKPSRLYIENFLCYDKSFIDFNQFSAALIVAKVENSDLVSNGAGKSTIFRAIEYVLFNQADANLDKIIREDTTFCKVVLDFVIGTQEYRLARTRTKKGTSDLTLLQKNSVLGTDTEVYHSITQSSGYDIYEPHTDKKETKKYWKDISGSRAGDTEKDLAKLIKINAKAFRSTIHFMQNDFAGLSTATAEKRKGILKEALNLVAYTKLEKLAKEQATVISKEIDKNRALLENIGDPTKELVKLQLQIVDVENSLVSKNDILSKINFDLIEQNNQINDLTNAHSNLESKFVALLIQEKTFTAEKSRLEISVKEYQSKKNNAAKMAKELIAEIKALKELQVKLIGVDYSQINILDEEINVLKEQISQNNASIKTNTEAWEDLKIPLPSGSVCKNCRKPMSDKDRQEHKNHIPQDIEACRKIIQDCSKSIRDINAEVIKCQQEINSLNLSKQQLEGVNINITAKNKEIQDKKDLYEDYSNLLDKFSQELSDKTAELNTIIEELKNSSIEEADAIKNQITAIKKLNAITISEQASLNRELSVLNSNKAVIQFSIDQKTKDQVKFDELKVLIKELEDKWAVYPSVILGFSSTGIPNLIIQNVLDDLQIEANNLLAQIKPGLQLSFFVEKTIEKTGDQADTLDINYQMNGKDRYYELLSGAQKLAVMFSLKLGLSFLLQKMIGTDIKFLLLDEIDQSLDKASVDAFADIVKFFQKDFTILIITHNDRLKDKFSHAILVDQDVNLISRARVVSSW